MQTGLIRIIIRIIIASCELFVRMLIIMWTWNREYHNNSRIASIQRQHYKEDHSSWKPEN